MTKDKIQILYKNYILQLYTNLKKGVKQHNETSCYKFSQIR